MRGSTANDRQAFVLPIVEWRLECERERERERETHRDTERQREREVVCLCVRACVLVVREWCASGVCV